MQRLLIALTGERPDYGCRSGSTFHALFRRGLVAHTNELTEEGRQVAKELIAMLPPPRVPTAEELRHRQVENLHNIFWPRRTSASPIATASKRLTELMVLLLEMENAANLLVKYKTIPDCTIARSGRVWRLLGKESVDDNALMHCFNKHGSTDLKDQCWSAYRELRRQHKGQAITPIKNLPFCYWAEASRDAIIAGNLDAGIALQAIAEHEIASFGVVGDVDPLVLGGMTCTRDRFVWQLSTLTFTPTGLGVLKDHFRRW